MVPGSTRDWIAVNTVQQSNPLSKKMKTKNMTTSQLRNSINRSAWRRGIFLLPLTLACFGLSPAVRAVTPPPDGGYPGWNTAEGQDALFRLTTGGSFNTAIGAHALYLNTTGKENTAVGAFTLAANNSGIRNVAIGEGALGHNTGSGNVAVGFQALFNNTTSGTPNQNTSQAVGFQALFKQQDGMSNNGFGWHALYNNVSGDNNTAIGHAAGLNITGNGNVDVGAGVGGVAGENNTTRIRNIGTTQLTGQMVVVDADGKLGYVASSRRYKDEIKPMDNDSEALFALKPVSFRYKGDIDPDHAKMFGLIAEEVAEVNPDLVLRNAKGEVDTIRFDSINAMLLNEFLKQHRKVQGMELIMAQQKKDFETTSAQQEKEIKSITASLRENAAQIQNVSARLATASPSRSGLEASKPEPRVVANQ
jgi:hypothetical protein